MHTNEVSVGAGFFQARAAFADQAAGTGPLPS